ncbi:ribbon-helix-helix protein, CopG family [Microbacterium esteraromaticum]|uniref:ribbon-helix-helix protein, CopG family n=1 Tax=Microbacterium esteraromaticum TaxID=57043 RepID=UPI001C9896ED|nr:ribbon-helix-helix protein, CopG family [Microbacterium esteraromaticum]MBY6061730.1 ribbon-helix-helix domain-containing protein [Microbacterium esteraromaticum]
MAMTVRLPEDLDAKLDEIARARHTSKHAVIIEAAERFANTESKTTRVMTLADGIIDRYADVMKRLEDA